MPRTLPVLNWKKQDSTRHASSLKKATDATSYGPGLQLPSGSFRGYQNETPVTIDTVTTRSQRIVTTGPVRSIIEVSDRGWIYNGKPVEMHQRYTVYDRHRDYYVEIKLTGADDNSTFCTGVQKLAVDNQGFITKSGACRKLGD